MDTHHAFALGFGICTAIFLSFFVAYIEIGGDVYALKRQAIERGYALHCPDDGKFAWVGECE